MQKKKGHISMLSSIELDQPKSTAMSSNLSLHVEQGASTGISPKSPVITSDSTTKQGGPAATPVTESTPLLADLHSASDEEAREEDAALNATSTEEHPRTVLDIVMAAITGMLGKGLAGLIGTVVVLVVLIRTLGGNTCPPGLPGDGGVPN